MSMKYWDVIATDWSLFCAHRLLKFGDKCRQDLANLVNQILYINVYSIYQFHFLVQRICTSFGKSNSSRRKKFINLVNHALLACANATSKNTAIIKSIFGIRHLHNIQWFCEQRTQFQICHWTLSLKEQISLPSLSTTGVTYSALTLSMNNQQTTSPLKKKNRPRCYVVNHCAGCTQMGTAISYQKTCFNSFPWIPGVKNCLSPPDHFLLEGELTRFQG